LQQNRGATGQKQSCRAESEAGELCDGQGSFDDARLCIAYAERGRAHRSLVQQAGAVLCRRGHIFDRAGHRINAVSVQNESNRPVS
jgi:hypothetical protein